MGGREPPGPAAYTYVFHSWMLDLPVHPKQTYWNPSRCIP